MRFYVPYSCASAPHGYMLIGWLGHKRRKCRFPVAHSVLPVCCDSREANGVNGAKRNIAQAQDGSLLDAKSNSVFSRKRSIKPMQLLINILLLRNLNFVFLNACNSGFENLHIFSFDSWDLFELQSVVASLLKSIVQSMPSFHSSCGSGNIFKTCQYVESEIYKTPNFDGFFFVCVSISVSVPMSVSMSIFVFVHTPVETRGWHQMSSLITLHLNFETGSPIEPGAH